MKIAFVGASGYGNVGDNTYPLIFSGFLSEHTLYYFNSDLPKEMPADLDLLVLGGGGILYNNPSGEDQAAPSPHFEKMEHYLKWAISAGVPFGFSSCGFQFRPNHEPRFRECLKPWVPYFEQASFITLRSPRCVQIMHELVGREVAQFYPDAAFLMPDLVDLAGVVPNSVGLTIVMAGRVSPGEQWCRRYVEFFSSAQQEVVWLSMGAPVDDEKQITMVRERYPNVRVIETPTPEEAYLHIARSRMVLTGRYHGMVFARATGVPFFFPEEVAYKLKSEDFSASPSDAMGHITVLRQTLAKLAVPAPAPVPVLA